MPELHYRDAQRGDEPAIQALVAGVLGEYGLAPDAASTDADLFDLGASYRERGGVFRVLVAPDGRIVGCGGLYRLDAREAEIRKMYLVPQARGQGLGRSLLRDLVQSARERGYERVVLETASVLKEAISLYRSFGFVPIERSHIACRCDQAMALELKARDVA